MRYMYGMLPVALVAALAAGCGGSGDSSRPTPELSQQATASGKGGPADVVTAFLEAIRRGDDDAVAALLSARAREKVAELSLAPKGSDTAQFQVGPSEVDEDVARVESTWSDYEADGQRHAEKILWMLRQEPEGWHVAGMAVTVFPGEPPLLLDFENPDEARRQIDLLDEEIARRDKADIQQANRTDGEIR